MIAPLAKWVDWWALQIWWTMQLKSMQKVRTNERSPRLEEALQFLNGPDFIPTESKPAQIEFNPDESGLHFHFPTPRPCDFPENNVVHGRLYRCGEHWRERPVIVLLHGGGDFLNHRFRYPFIARHCNRAGFNAATLEAPYHFQRRLRQRPASDIQGWLRLAETFAQAVAEIRALTGWLLAQGCPGVALWGISYGGWLAGLTAIRDPRLTSVVLTVPGVGMGHILPMANRAVWRRVREELQEQRPMVEALNMTPLNLTLAQPVISKENILLIGGLYDLFAGSEPIEDLWQAWGRPDIWRLPHGHVSWMGVPGFTDRVLRWLAPRLNPQRSKSEL